MPTDPALDITLTHISGAHAPLDDWLTTFHLAVAVLDPFEYESAWLLDTAGRILDTFSEADCRVGFIVTATPEQAREFVGPWADELFVLCDPDKALVKSMGLEQLPAFVHLGLDGTLLGSAQGWNPTEWKAVSQNLAKAMSWIGPDIPQPGDPKPYQGAAAV